MFVIGLILQRFRASSVNADYEHSVRASPIQILLSDYGVFLYIRTAVRIRHDVCSVILDPNFSWSFAYSIVVDSERSKKTNPKRTSQFFLPALTF